MKRLIPFFLAIILTAIGAYALAAKKKDAAAAEALDKQRAAWNAERRLIEDELAKAKQRPVIVQAATSQPVTGIVASRDPAEILAELKKLRASSRDPRSIRRVIFHLEELGNMGSSAVPSIRAFLNQFEDVDYYSVAEGGAETEEARRGPPRPDQRDERNRFNPRDFRSGRRSDVRLTFVTPPSLRLGLIDVLERIGGPEAEEALGEVLETTGRAVEVAYVATALQRIAPNEHGVAAVTAAKDLLRNPAQPTPGDRLDQDSKDYLYHVLAMFNDTSFAADAQAMLVTHNGTIDRDALAYLNETLKDQAMPAIYQAFMDQRITNQWERASLMNMALAYAGPNQQANEMLNSVISNDTIPSQMRAMALMSLTRGEPDEQTIRARLPLVEALKGSTDDERVQRSLDFAYQNLNNMLEGKPVEEPWRVFRGGDDPGQRGRSPEGRR